MKTILELQRLADVNKQTQSKTDLDCSSIETLDELKSALIFLYDRDSIIPSGINISQSFFDKLSRSEETINYAYAMCLLEPDCSEQIEVEKFNRILNALNIPRVSIDVSMNPDKCTIVF
jgi:reverse gyrase